MRNGFAPLRFGAFACIAAVLLLAPLARAQDSQLIPRDVFFGNPERSNIQVSPDGRHLAFLAPHNNVMNVWVQSIASVASGSGDARPITSSADRPIRVYQWAHNSQQIIYRQDRGGDENFHIFAVNVADGQEIDLSPFENVQARIAADDRDFPDEILLAVNNRDPQLHDIVRVNTRTGASEVLFQNDGGFADLRADSGFAVRLASKITADGGSIAYLRDSADGEWYELASWKLEDAEASGALSFSRDGRTVYLSDSPRRQHQPPVRLQGR